MTDPNWSRAVAISLRPEIEKLLREYHEHSDSTNFSETCRILIAAGLEAKTSKVADAAA